MDYDGLLELVKKRRSIRRFKPDPIPDESIDKIIEVARWAPSGFNSQPWDFVIVKKEDLRKKIIAILHDAIPWLPKEGEDLSHELQALNPIERLIVSKPPSPAYFSNAPVFIILFGDLRTKVGLPSGMGKIPEEKFLEVLNASLANTFLLMHLAAATLGLASQWWSAVSFPPVQSAIKTLIGIPEDLVAFDMMVLGYPGAVSRSKLLRNKEKMVHFDDCGIQDFRTTEEVHDFAMRTKSWAIGQHRREYRQKK